jgi:hypothetical protein
MKQTVMMLMALSLASLGCGDNNLQAVRARLATPPATIDFGTLPVLNKKTIEIPLSNLGSPTLTVSAVTLTKADGIFVIQSAPDAVAGGETKNIVVVFTPEAEQRYDEVLTFQTNDDENKSVSVALLGVGSTRASIDVQPAALDFGRVGECASSVQLLNIISRGTADLVIEEVALTADTSPAFSLVGSTKTPATVQNRNGQPGEIQVTVRVAIPPGSVGPLSGAIRIRSTDPEQRERLVALSAVVNQAPIAQIAPLGNGALGQMVMVDGTGSSDPDGDAPLTYQWTLRNKPLASATTLMSPTASSSALTLDPSVPGAYEVQLSVTDSQGVRNCQPARATIVAAPAQKLLVEMFWDNAATDVDLHVLRDANSPLGVAPDDCFYQNRKPDWGQLGLNSDNPELVRDALTGYGPEVFGYVNPVQGTYRILSVFENELLSPMPTSKVTVRIYFFGVLKAEVSRTLERGGSVWEVADVAWPSGDVTVFP